MEARAKAFWDDFVRMSHFSVNSNSNRCTNDLDLIGQVLKWQRQHDTIRADTKHDKKSKIKGR